MRDLYAEISAEISRRPLKGTWQFFWRPQTYLFQDIREFNEKRTTLRPTTDTLSWSRAHMFDGLAVVRFENNIQFHEDVDGDTDYYLGDLTGNTSVLLSEALSTSGLRFGLSSAERSYLQQPRIQKDGCTLICITALYRKSSESLHLFSYTELTEQTRRRLKVRKLFPWQGTGHT